jgi:hypothetical protein
MAKLWILLRGKSWWTSAGQGRGATAGLAPIADPDEAEQARSADTTPLAFQQDDPS